MHLHWKLRRSANVWIVTSCTVLCMLGGGPVSCIDAPRSPEERADSQTVVAMECEVPPKQKEHVKTELPRGFAQPHLKEKRCMGLVHVCAHVHFCPI